MLVTGVDLSVFRGGRPDLAAVDLLDDAGTGGGAGLTGIVEGGDGGVLSGSLEAGADLLLRVFR